MARKTPFKIKLGEKIKHLRKDMNLTQGDLSSRLGVLQSTIANYESGYSQPDQETLIKLASIFNVSVDYLLGSTSILNPKQYLENNLSKYKLSEPEYNLIMNKIIKNKTLEIVTPETSNMSKEQEINASIFSVYMDYLKSNSIEETNINDESINFIDETFLNMLKTLDKSKIIDASTDVKSSAIVFIYGTIPAGIPMECIEDIIDTEEISADMLKGNKEYFGLRIKGNSMFPEYLDGDTLILQKVEDCESGQDCCVMVNGDDGTFKRVFKNENGIILQPLNPEYQPLVYTNEQIEQLPVRIIGKVVELRRKK